MPGSLIRMSDLGTRVEGTNLGEKEGRRDEFQGCRRRGDMMGKGTSGSLLCLSDAKIYQPGNSQLWDCLDDGTVTS